jgi:hypothetical protein
VRGEPGTENKKTPGNWKYKIMPMNFTAPVAGMNTTGFWRVFGPDL